MRLGADSSPEMPRPNVLSVGKGHEACQNESGPTTMMELLRTTTQKIEMNRRFDDIRQAFHGSIQVSKRHGKENKTITVSLEIRFRFNSHVPP